MRVLFFSMQAISFWYPSPVWTWTNNHEVVVVFSILPHTYHILVPLTLVSAYSKVCTSMFIKKNTYSHTHMLGMSFDWQWSRSMGTSSNESGMRWHLIGTFNLEWSLLSSFLSCVPLLSMGDSLTYLLFSEIVSISRVRIKIWNFNLPWPTAGGNNLRKQY